MLEVSTQQFRETILTTIDGAGGELRDLATRIHETPELGFKEVKASQWLTDALTRRGFQVTRGVADLPTAFRAEVGGHRPGPAVAILAEYDALPELGHACGHNLICTMALGAAFGLAAVKESVPGKTVILGTPAEEGGGGKVLMLQGRAFAGVDAAMMVHGASYTLPIRPSLASYRLKVKYIGKEAHAAAAPFEGINALDALIQLFVSIGLLRQQLREDTRIHGIITYGGAAPNIIPARAEAAFSVRASDGAYAKEALDKVIAAARAAAQATGATLEFETKKGYDAMRSNPALADAFAHHLEELNWPVDVAPERPRMGSTDMGDVSRVIPSIHPYIAIGRDLVGHTPEFREAAKTPQAYDAMLVGAKAMALTALDVLTNPTFLEQVRADFRST